MQTLTQNMLKRERQEFILRQINLHNKVLSSDLSIQLAVSEDTVRRDLNELAEQGKIQKVHGGALSNSFHFPYSLADVYAPEAKKVLAQKTHQLFKDGMVILTGGGTSMIEMSRSLPADLKATFFTVSPLVALQLAEHPQLDVILLGGKLSSNSHISIGSMVISQLAEIRVDLCLLGTNGLSAENGLTDSDWEVVQVKKAMIRSANQLAVLSIAEKLESVQRMKICETAQLNYLVTELAPEDPRLKKYQKKGITLL